MVTHAVAESRYHRQEALLQNQGWDQSKLANATVTVIGSGSLAHYASLTLMSFGFGTIEIFGTGLVQRTKDYSQGFLDFQAREGNPMAKAMAEQLSLMNLDLAIRGIALPMDKKDNCKLIGEPQLIIEATNNPISKMTVAQYGLAHHIPVISMGAGESKGGIGIVTSGEQKKLENLLFTDIAAEAQNPVIAEVIAGVGVEEARKIINPLRGEQVLEDLVLYNQHSSTRFSHSQDHPQEYEINLKDYSILLVGAGALGNFIGLGLSQLNIGSLTVVDFDDVEMTNLNRQILFYDSVGQDKARALVAKLRQINPNGTYRAKIEKITPESGPLIARGDYDLIIDGVDNFKARALLNYFSLKYDIPFISGGTTYQSGQARIMIPGETPCLDCQADIDALALGKQDASAQQGTSCIYAAQPSVITSNQIIGGLIVGEVAPVLDHKHFGMPPSGQLMYASNGEYRLSLGPLPASQCTCNEPEQLNAWPEKMKKVYEEK